MNLENRARMHAALGDPHRLAIVDAIGISDLTPQELGTLLGLPSNLLAHHLNVLADAGLVERRVSEGDRRRRYVVLRASNVDTVAHAAPLPAGIVLFVCTHNSARSQFAAALWAQRTGAQRLSAGTRPAAAVHPAAVRVAARAGIDLSGTTPLAYEAVEVVPDLVVSVCDRAGEAPTPFGAPRLHWSIPDPVAVGRITAFRSAFTEIGRRIADLADSAVGRDR